MKTSHKLRVLFTDIDDTLTHNGRLGPEAYQALWKLHEAGLHIVPITGRPAGWCEMIARFWPVSGVIGENGSLYFRLLQDPKKNMQFMKRHFQTDEASRKKHQEKLKLIEQQILKEVPGSAVSSDQFCRLTDLSIDFCEDVPRLSDHEINRIVEIFQLHGATAKVSSIHVNGWFGTYDKLSMCRVFAQNELGLDINTPEGNAACAFTGDAPNDEPMFAFFKNSFGVANIRNFLHRIKTPPTYISEKEGGHGFVEIAEILLRTIKGSSER